MGRPTWTLLLLRPTQSATVFLHRLGRGRTWLRRQAGLATPASGPAEEQLLKRIAAFAHDDDVERAAQYTRLVSGPIRYDEPWERETRIARRLFFSLCRLAAAAPDTDAFFVALRRAELDYSPTTMQRDHAISPELFHWDSQNATAVASPTGQRCLNHRERGSHVLILVRETKTLEWNGPRPFLCLGTAAYVSHQGERPIAVAWTLPPPEDRRRLPPGGDHGLTMLSTCLARVRTVGCRRGRGRRRSRVR